MTLRLREHLIKAWEAQGGGDVRASPRAMEKLLKEAERLKVVLSANTEFYAQIESLLDDKDFKVQVSTSHIIAVPRVYRVVNVTLLMSVGLMRVTYYGYSYHSISTKTEIILTLNNKVT